MKKKDRNMFYSDYQAGGFINPNMNPNYQMNPIPNQNMPSGYMLNNNYMSYGPNALPEQYNEYSNQNDYENRINKLERQVRKLEARVSKLENNAEIIEKSTDDLYII